MVMYDDCASQSFPVSDRSPDLASPPALCVSPALAVDLSWSDTRDRKHQVTHLINKNELTRKKFTRRVQSPRGSSLEGSSGGTGALRKYLLEI